MTPMFTRATFDERLEAVRASLPALRDSAAPEADAESFGESATAFYAAEVTLWLVDNLACTEADFKTARDLHAALLVAMSEALIDALVEGDPQGEQFETRMRDGIRDEHVLCSLCVIVLAAHDLGKKEYDRAVGTLAQEVVARLQLPTELQTRIARGIVNTVLMKAANLLWEKLADPKFVMVVRLLGLIACPDWDAHPGNALYHYCVRPLILKALQNGHFAYLEDRFGSAAE